MAKAQDVPSLLGYDNLSPLPYLYRSKYMLSLWRNRQPYGALIKVQQIVQRHTIELRKRVTMQQVRQALAGFPNLKR